MSMFSPTPPFSPDVLPYDFWLFICRCWSRDRLGRKSSRIRGLFNTDFRTQNHGLYPSTRMCFQSGAETVATVHSKRRRLLRGDLKLIGRYVRLFVRVSRNNCHRKWCAPCALELLNRVASNWTVMSCQPHKVVPGRILNQEHNASKSAGCLFYGRVTHIQCTLNS